MRQKGGANHTCDKYESHVNRQLSVIGKGSCRYILRNRGIVMSSVTWRCTINNKRWIPQRNHYTIGKNKQYTWGEWGESGYARAFHQILPPPVEWKRRLMFFRSSVMHVRIFIAHLHKITHETSKYVPRATFELLSGLTADLGNRWRLVIIMQIHLGEILRNISVMQRLLRCVDTVMKRIWTIVINYNLIGQCNYYDPIDIYTGIVFLFGIVVRWKPSGG